MSYSVMGSEALDYAPCRYGKSKVLFRGPKRDLVEPHLAFIGGTETYGKFIKTPFPELLEESIGKTCVNFGLPNAGIDVFTQSRFLTQTLAKAEVTVVQVLGAQNMTNRFYSVHPRRNDRFVAASSTLKQMYPEIDFVEINFTKHLMQKLLRVSPERFEVVLCEIQEAWVARMRLLLGQIKGKSLLLWLSQIPTPSNDDLGKGGAGPDPVFISREMLEEIRPRVTDMLEVVTSRQALNSGVYGMVFQETEAAAAKRMLGPLAHQEIAIALEVKIKEML